MKQLGDVGQILSDNDYTEVLSIIAEKTGMPIDEEILTQIDKEPLNDLLKMNNELQSLRENLNEMRRKFSFYIVIFIICCLTFFETIFYVNTVSLVLSLIIGTASFIIIEKENRKRLKIKRRMEELEEDIKKRASNLVEQYLVSNK